MSEYASYGWVITKDHLYDGKVVDRDSKGQLGPSSIDPAIESQLVDAWMRDSGGQEFQMLDGDGELYYTGRYIGPNDERMFRPLDDFGTPDSGAVTIKYKNANGEWEIL